MSKRAEEVAGILRNYYQSSVHAGSGFLEKEAGGILASLPEFQDGRELTETDVRTAYRDAPSSGKIWKQMAAKLNKIRAPKDSHPFTHEKNVLEMRVKSLEKERDELKAQSKAMQELADGYEQQLCETLRAIVCRGRQPRFVPSPPVEEESELVRNMRDILSDEIVPAYLRAKAIAIVQKHEKGSK